VYKRIEGLGTREVYVCQRWGWESNSTNEEKGTESWIWKELWQWDSPSSAHILSKHFQCSYWGTSFLTFKSFSSKEQPSDNWNYLSQCHLHTSPISSPGTPQNEFRKKDNSMAQVPILIYDLLTV
jgi:hypothetical protein